VKATIGVRWLALGLGLLAALSAGAPAVFAQGAANEADDQRERTFVEGLRREDPANADRYVSLRDARHQAMAALQKAQAQYAAAGPELRSLVIRQLQDAQRQYAKSSLALLDFLDERDRRFLARYQDEIARIGKVLEEHAKVRAELQKQLSEP
jgi:hypothetical protein